ncbi:hypothetical protein [Parvibaculum sp.]|uniref:hypothetical protein n=1 Tax=Parvibaculum sp. TaxID=2024848 RepID=UPI00320F8078
MPPLSSSFGFYPAPLTIVGEVSIKPLPNFEDTTRGYEAWADVEAGWIYAPMMERRSFDGYVHPLPYPSRVFGLPKTHEISIASSEDREQLEFHVWVLSFFVGMRLTTTEAGFVDATPAVPNKLFDFIVGHSDIERSIELAERFWRKHRNKPVLAKRLTAAIHALLLAQYPQALQYEQFIHLYAALDACYAIVESVFGPTQRIIHAKRTQWMCEQLKLDTPEWAKGLEAPSANAEVAALRNAAIHEALFVGEPLGFAIRRTESASDITLEMTALVCRILVSILDGGPSQYLASPVNTRQRYFLSLPR